MLNTSAARDRLELGREDRLDIRSALLRVLTDLYLQRPAHTPEDERCYTELALRLLDAVDVSERAAIAERLAVYSAAPRPLIERLARDVDEVAAPILDHPIWLSPAETAAEPTAGAVPSTTPLPAGPVRAFRAASARAEAHALSELFYTATFLERRLILANLEFAALIPMAPLSSAARSAMSRLLSAVPDRDYQAVARRLEFILGLSRSQAQRIVSDAGGEPIAVIGKAMDLPAQLVARWLAQRGCAPAGAADCVHVFAALYQQISADAARRLIAIWQSADGADTDARGSA